MVSLIRDEARVFILPRTDRFHNGEDDIRQNASDDRDQNGCNDHDQPQSIKLVGSPVAWLDDGEQVEKIVDQDEQVADQRYSDIFLLLGHFSLLYALVFIM